MVPRKLWKPSEQILLHLTESNMAREEDIYLVPWRGKGFQGGESQDSSQSSLVELTKTEVAVSRGETVVSNSNLVY